MCVVATKEKVILDFKITDSLPDAKALIPLMKRIKNRFPEGKIKRIVSDEDNAIIEAENTVFHEASHSFCVYHQLKNVSKKYHEEFNKVPAIFFPAFFPVLSGKSASYTSFLCDQDFQNVVSSR